MWEWEVPDFVKKQWGIKNLQLSEESIPACNSIECLTKSAADAGDPKHP